MDVYLTREALSFLEAQALDSIPAHSGGLLLGHKRGQRFFVEKVFPCRPGFFLSLAHFFALDHHFEGKILGFYFFNNQKAIKARLLQPFACGKAYLEVKRGRKKLIFKPSVIDFQKRFFFQPATIVIAPGEKNA